MKDKLAEMLDSYKYKVQKTVNILGVKVDIPVVYSDARVMMVIFTAPISKLTSLVQSPRLKPVGLTPKTGIIALNIFEYRKCPIGPFYEFTISTPIVFDSYRIHFFPLVFDQLFNNFGFYVLRIGANSKIAREHIKKIFPYPIYDKSLEIFFEANDGIISTGINDENKEVIVIRSKTPKSL